jgi:hypothetical protein
MIPELETERMWLRQVRLEDAEQVQKDGSLPLYVGKGNIKHRITDARRSKRRGQLWDRFSWYAVADAKMMHDLEVLVLRILPRYLRVLTRQEGHTQFLATTEARRSVGKEDAHSAGCQIDPRMGVEARTRKSNCVDP